MANQQGALPDPKAACHPATEDSVDLDFQILDVESQILDVATALAASARLATSLREYLLPPERLAALSPANRLKLLRNHLSRLQNRLSASAPRQNETDQMLREDSGQQTRVASELASQPAAFGGSNALASVPMPSCMNACAVQPPKSRRDSRQPARVASEDSEPASQPGERNALASDPNLPKPSKIKNMAMQCSRLTFVSGATVSASEAPVRAVPPLPPCSFVGDKTSAPRIASLWNFLVTACQTPHGRRGRGQGRPPSPRPVVAAAVDGGYGDVGESTATAVRVTPQRVAASGALAGGISAKAALPAPAAAAGEGAGAAGGAPAGAPAPAALASAAAWRSLRAAQPPRLRGASLGPRKSTRRRGPTASADRCRTPACIRAVLR